MRSLIRITIFHSILNVGPIGIECVGVVVIIGIIVVDKSGSCLELSVSIRVIVSCSICALESEDVKRKQVCCRIPPLLGP